MGGSNGGQAVRRPGTVCRRQLEDAADKVFFIELGNHLTFVRLRFGRVLFAGRGRHATVHASPRKKKRNKKKKKHYSWIFATFREETFNRNKAKQKNGWLVAYATHGAESVLQRLATPAVRERSVGSEERNTGILWRGITALREQDEGDAAAAREPGKNSTTKHDCL